MSQARLPLHHVRRPRLVERVAAVPVAVIEAPGGYGKSALTAEVGSALGIATAGAVLDRHTDDPALLASALRRGFARAHLTDVAGAIEVGEGTDASVATAQLADALERRSEPVLLVVDEVQRAEGRAAELLSELVGRIPSPHHVVLSGRRLPERVMCASADLGAAVIGGSDLAFTRDEVAEVLASTLDRTPDRGETDWVLRVTDGWPAAVVVAAAQLARGAPLAAAAAGSGSAALAALLDAMLFGDVTGAVAASAVELAHLPLLSSEVATACAGEGTWAGMVDAGLPLVPATGGWYTLPDPVRDELARRGPLEAVTARKAACVYANRGELPAATALLFRISDQEGLVGLLAERPWRELEQLEVPEIRGLLHGLAPDVLARHARALLNASRMADAATAFAFREATLAKATEALRDGSDQVLRREVLAEVALDRAVNGDVDAAEEVARDVLANAGPRELASRGRALTALGRAGAFRREPASMVDAEQRLTEAVSVLGALGDSEWRAGALLFLGYGVCYALGELERARSHLEDALAALPGGTRFRAVVATYAAEGLGYVGRVDEAEAHVREADEIGRRLGDHRVRAYAAWVGAQLSARRGDLGGTVERLRAVERNPGDWYEHPTGIEFLAEAAQLLVRLGDVDGARRYLERAEERAAAIGHEEIAGPARAELEARVGDPEPAERLLRSLFESPQLPPREHWRVLMLRALAAERRGCDSDAALFAARAFEAAAMLGHPELPALHEPLLAERLRAAGAVGGADRAPAGAQLRERCVVTVLGGFAVTDGGRPANPPPGHTSTLVKLLAVRNAPVPADEVIEILWEEVDPDVGRRRLRNVLNRVRRACPDLVARSEEAIVLGGSVRVDASEFEAAAAGALRADPDQRAGLARTALARYAGDLLPADPYEPWATAPRERLRHVYLDLLDLVVEEAVSRGDHDEALRLLEQAIAAQPLDEWRYVRAAELCRDQGRHGAARAYADRASAVLDDLGLPPSARLRALREALGGVPQRP